MLHSYIEECSVLWKGHVWWMSHVSWKYHMWKKKNSASCTQNTAWAKSVHVCKNEVVIERYYRNCVYVTEFAKRLLYTQLQIILLRNLVLKF